mgnify:CR=1 FL=1
MDNENTQIIYINMDDSGRLIKGEPNELVFIYGGVFFLSLKEQENFSRQYKALVDIIKPKYCKSLKNDISITNEFCISHSYQNCKYNCPELKSNMLKPKDRRRLLNFIKKYDTSVAVVSNYQLKDYIFDSKASKGRFKDYIIKREVKRIVENLISQNRINSKLPVKLVLNLDEQSTVSNGYYDLESSIKEELQFGVMNYDYGITFPPILSSVQVKVKYRNSYYNYPVQAADLLVGEVRHCYYNYLQNQDFETYRKRTNFLNTSIYLP